MAKKDLPDSGRESGDFPLGGCLEISGARGIFLRISSRGHSHGNGSGHLSKKTSSKNHYSNWFVGELTLTLISKVPAVITGRRQKKDPRALVRGLEEGFTKVSS